MRSTGVPDLDIRGLSAAYLARVEQVCPRQLPLAARVLERLEPSRWTLEWYLPWWLGHAFGLGTDLSSEIVLSNVLGLASIRLQDDLADGEVAADEVAGARALSAALYDDAVAVYRSRFARSSPFWGRLAGYMADWRSATDGIEPLARRGAPLKIAAFAVCLLAGRTDRFEALDRCLEHTLAAMVLYDDLGDWEDDLAAVRWNAFVAGVSPYPQVSENRGRNRARVLVAMMTEGAVVGHFARIGVELAGASRAAEALGVSPLVDHLQRYAVRIEEQGLALESHYREVADQATRALFGTGMPVVGAVGVSPKEGVAS